MTRGGEMTLEQAIADWRDQIGKLRAERDAWRKLVVEHNAECERLCKSGWCSSADYLERCVPRCPGCNLYDVIEIPPELQP